MIKLIISFAWRNLWRNKKRTFILVLSIFIGVWALFTAISFLNGLNKSFFNNAINTEYSHIQIHHADYEMESDTESEVQVNNNLSQVLNSNSKILSVAHRSITEGLIMSPKSSYGVKIIGVNPNEEIVCTEMNKLITEGTYFKSGKKHPIILGKKLAERIGIKLNSKVVITLVDKDKEITSDVFKVAGIYDSYSSKINSSYIYILNKDFQELYNKEGFLNEIAVRLNNIEDVDFVTEKIKEANALNSVKTWKELAPNIEISQKQTDIDKATVFIVIILTFTIGLISTLVMQISERSGEIGILIANGMSRFKVFILFILESLIVVLSATILSMFFGILIIEYLGNTGLNFSSYADTFQSMGWSKIVYLNLSQTDYLITFLSCVAAAIIGAVFPASIAFRINPIEIIGSKK